MNQIQKNPLLLLPLLLKNNRTHQLAIKVKMKDQVNLIKMIHPLRKTPLPAMMNQTILNPTMIHPRTTPPRATRIRKNPILIIREGLIVPKHQTAHPQIKTLREALHPLKIPNPNRAQNHKAPQLQTMMHYLRVKTNNL